MEQAIVAYNSVGDVLAVSGHTEAGNELQLWVRGNYHWYLKIRRIYEETIHGLFWDLVDPLHLTVLFEVCDGQ